LEEESLEVEGSGQSTSRVVRKKTPASVSTPIHTWVVAVDEDIPKVKGKRHTISPPYRGWQLVSE